MSTELVSRVILTVRQRIADERLGESTAELEALRGKQHELDQEVARLDARKKGLEAQLPSPPSPKEQHDAMLAAVRKTNAAKAAQNARARAEQERVAKEAAAQEQQERAANAQPLARARAKEAKAAALAEAEATRKAKAEARAKEKAQQQAEAAERGRAERARAEQRARAQEQRDREAAQLVELAKRQAEAAAAAEAEPAAEHAAEAERERADAGLERRLDAWAKARVRTTAKEESWFLKQERRRAEAVERECDKWANYATYCAHHANVEEWFPRGSAEATRFEGSALRLLFSVKAMRQAEREYAAVDEDNAAAKMAAYQLAAERRTQAADAFATLNKMAATKNSQVEQRASAAWTDHQAANRRRLRRDTAGPSYFLPQEPRHCARQPAWAAAKQQDGLTRLQVAVLASRSSEAP